MKPYTISIIPEEDFQLFKKIEIVVNQMPEVDLINKKGEKELLSCHMLARAVERFFPVKCHDGYCEHCQHSWLTTKNGNIIDAYPIGIIGGPILIATEYFHPFTSCYKERPLDVVKGEQFQINTAIVSEAVRQTIEKLGILVAIKI